MSPSPEFIFDTPRSANRTSTNRSTSGRGGACNRPDTSDDVILDLTAVVFSLLLKDGRTVEIKNASSYQPEGPLTTFFFTESSRQTIDSWSTRLGSYRTADIVAIERREAATFVAVAPTETATLRAA